MRRVKLTRLETDGNFSGIAPRTSSIEGFCFRLPELGKPFTVWGEPLDPEAEIRSWRTSLVTVVEDDDVDRVVFETLNSTYELRILG